MPLMKARDLLRVVSTILALAGVISFASVGECAMPACVDYAAYSHFLPNGVVPGYVVDVLAFDSEERVLVASDSILRLVDPNASPFPESFDGIDLPRPEKAPMSAGVKDRYLYVGGGATDYSGGDLSVIDLNDTPSIVGTMHLAGAPL